MVDAHGIVGGDGPVDEGEALVGIVVFAEIIFDDARFVPIFEELVFLRDEVGIGVYFREANGGPRSASFGMS